MRYDLSDAYPSVVRIVARTGSSRIPIFLGTGLVVSAKRVITCAHVIRALTELHTDCGEKPEWPSVQCGSVAYRATAGSIVDKMDLCILTFARLPRTSPRTLTRTAKLKGMHLVALGFDARDPSRIMEVHDLIVLNEGLSDKRSQWAQLAGGLPRGFSGAPVLAHLRGSWRVLGMIQLGGDEAVTSRLVGADAMATFLAREGTRFSKAVPSK